MKMTSLLIIILNCTLAWAQAAPPDWFTNGSHRGYQEEFYITGVGSGSSYDDAINKASAQISRQISTEVESELNSVTSSYEENDRESISYEFNDKIKIVTDNTVTGAQVVEKAEAGGVFYVFMALDKDNFGEGLKSELDVLQADIEKQYAESRNLLEKGIILPSLDILLTTGEQAVDLATKSALYTAITGKPYQTTDVLMPASLTAKARTIISEIELDKISGDKQSAQAGNLLPEPLKVKASYGKGSNATPLIRIPLKLISEDNLILDRGATDDKGEADFWVTAFGDEKAKVSVIFDLKSAPPVLKRDLKRVEAVFKFDVMSVPPLTFSVQVFDQLGNRLENVEEIVTKSILDAGHHVSKDAFLSLAGKVEKTESQEVDGISGKQYLVKSELKLFLTVQRTGERVGSVILSGKGMNSASEAKAEEASRQKLKVDKKELIGLLADAKVKLQPMLEEYSLKALEQGRIFYNQGKFTEALEQLSQVSTREDLVMQSRELIDRIKKEMRESNKAGE